MSLAFTKMAILFLYMRILDRGFVRLASNFVLGIVVVSNLWVLVSFFIQCIPLQAVWDPTVRGWCLPNPQAGMVNSILHVVTDFLIFVLPIRSVWGLKMRWSQKISVICLFGIGFMCVLPCDVTAA